MKKVKKISAITLTVIFLSSFFAIPVNAVDPVSTGMALASAIDAYGMAYGIGSVYDVTDANGVVISFDGLWDEFSLYQSNNGDSYNYQDYYDNFDDSPSIQAFSHSSGKFAGFYIDAESAEVFDKFWNWLLSGPAEMVKVDNQYQWNVDQVTNEIDPVTVYSTGIMPSIPKISSSATAVSAFENSKLAFSTSNYTYGVSKTTDNPYYVCVVNDGNSVGAVIYSLDGSSPYYSSKSITNNYGYQRIKSTVAISSNPTIFRSISSQAQSSIFLESYVPLYTSTSASDAAIISWISNPTYDSISVKPHDNTNTQITLPDVTSPDYEPTAKEIITNIPWDDYFDDTDEDENGQPIPFPPSSVTPVVGDMISSIIEDGFSIEDDPQDPDPDVPPPAPSEVFTPLLPVSPPSFEFNFSGIWHYVREWVSSLGAWFSIVFTVWGILPYAIVVPVYATAVVVIVLGVYKRFFM